MSSAILDYPPGIFEYLDSESVSDEGSVVETLFNKTREDLQSVFSLGFSREECLNQLIEASQQASKVNWDGYGAATPDVAALKNAYAFINILPSTIGLPDISIDSDGEVSFDWFDAPKRQFSISIGSLGVLSYAGLFGSDRVAGSERFEGIIPRTLLHYINRVAT